VLEEVKSEREKSGSFTTETILSSDLDADSKYLAA